MKCCICGHSVGQWGNDPYPLCSANDYESRCCDLCNNMVIKARIINSMKDNDNIQIGDTIICSTKNGYAPVVVNKIEILDECPIDIPVKKVCNKKIRRNGIVVEI